MIISQPFDVLTNEIVIGWLVNILSIKGEFESVSRIERCNRK
jgi:hypothetical protein